MRTHLYAGKRVLLERLQHALSLHLQALCSGQEVDLRQALLAYEITAQLAGLNPLPEHTLDVLRSKVTTPSEVQSELRALYIGIRRVATDNATLEWDIEQSALCEKLYNSIRLSKVNHCFDYLFTPANWHQQQRKLLLEKSDLILPLALFGSTTKAERCLRRALRIDRNTPICTAYNRLTLGELRAEVSQGTSLTSAS